MLKSNIKFEKFNKALIALETIYLKPMQEDRSNIDATMQRFEFTFEVENSHTEIFEDFIFDF